MKIEVCVDDWLQSILVCPIAKGPIVSAKDHYLSEAGFESRGVPDFRVKINVCETEWEAGQNEFEAWLSRYLDNGEKDAEFYKREVEADCKVYSQFNLSGRVLDVGGQLGQVRKYLSSGCEYCSLDPFVGVHLLASDRKSLFSHYPLHHPLNFVGGFAEFLPFKSNSFDSLNMRSCIDHFFNPQLALLEAFRVLKEGGRIVIGIKMEPKSFSGKAKETIRPIAGFLFKKYRDHHLWHPSYSGLIQLCSDAGFFVEKEIWQTSDIYYGQFKKVNTLKMFN